MMDCCEVEETRNTLVEEMHRISEETNQINAAIDDIALALFDVRAANQDEMKVSCFQDELRMNYSRLIEIRQKIKEIEKRLIK